MLEGAGAGAALTRSSQLSDGVRSAMCWARCLVDPARDLRAGVRVPVAHRNHPQPRRWPTCWLPACPSSSSPFLGITETLLYYDIRIRKEGFDVEYLAATQPRDGRTGRAALTATAWQDAARDTITRWSARAIHDTVARDRESSRRTSTPIAAEPVRAFLAVFVRSSGGSPRFARRIVQRARDRDRRGCAHRGGDRRRGSSSRAGSRTQRGRVRAGRGGARVRTDHWTAARDLAQRRRSRSGLPCVVRGRARFSGAERNRAAFTRPRRAATMSREVARRGATTAPAFRRVCAAVRANGLRHGGG